MDLKSMAMWKTATSLRWISKQSRNRIINSSEDQEKDMDVTDSDWDRVDPFQEKTEESSVTTVNNDREDDDYLGSSRQLREPDSTDWSLLGYLAELVIKAIEFQIRLRNTTRVRFAMSNHGFASVLPGDSVAGMVVAGSVLLPLLTPSALYVIHT